MIFHLENQFISFELLGNKIEFPKDPRKFGSRKKYLQFKGPSKALFHTFLHSQRCHQLLKPGAEINLSVAGVTPSLDPCSTSRLKTLPFRLIFHCYGSAFPTVMQPSYRLSSCVASTSIITRTLKPFFQVFILYYLNFILPITFFPVQSLSFSNYLPAKVTAILTQYIRE